MEAMVAAEGDLDDSSLCEENPLFGGPEEQKALMLSMSTATLPEGQTVGEARAAGDALGGALGDVESSAPTTPEEEHLIAVSETIPDETPSAEVMTAVVDGMFAHCGI